MLSLICSNLFKIIGFSNLGEWAQFVYENGMDMNNQSNRVTGAGRTPSRSKRVKRDHKEFAERLDQALIQYPQAPSGHGRQRWLAMKLGVSDETVRKWIIGQAHPNRQRMRELAALLEQDEAWLALGISKECVGLSR